ncbi:MAG: hypothetical protein WKF75_15630 [Singulisphaera sp.]
MSVPPDATLPTIVGKFGDKGASPARHRRERPTVGIISWADIAHYASDRSVGQVVSKVVEQS